eukprot:TRINITY_DN2573_c0_g1_i2.p1 TRINITY_DN2573_c0_g1~~TRINITY_DN2573_c0_g1_i2.p1  ORF type:complete len:375 (+),score=53.44 TRINITY_DN2573_c0_g1_i2:68-1192(+)
MSGQRKKSVSLTPGALPQRRGSIVDRLKSLKPFGGSGSTLEGENISGEKVTLSSFLAQTDGPQPTERCNHTATLVEDNLVIIGGRDPESDSHFGDIHVLNLQTMTWTKPTLSGDTFTPRCLHSATLLTDQKTIVVIGGTSGRQQCDEVVYINTETWHVDSFQGIDRFPGNGIAGHAVVYTPPHEIFVFGGRYTTTGHAGAETHIFNTESRTWNEVSATGKILPRAGHSATVLTGADGKQYVGLFGGKNSDGTVDEKIIVFDLNFSNYSKLETHGKGPSKSRFFHAAIVHRSILLFIGGKTEISDEGMESIYTFDTKNSKWKKIKDRKLLSLNGRYGHSATLHKGNIVIFGGCHSRTSYNDVHILHVEEASGLCV